MTRKLTLAVALATALAVSSAAQATVVQFQTALGNFEINLYDQKTPGTVANFLAYLNAGAYNNVVIHRSVKGFVIQGGGFAYAGSPQLATVSQNAAIANDPKYSNVRGTIAMAKLASSANSATNQWFINLADNSADLDVQNGGFTVFGEVTGTGMTVVDAIAALPVYNLGSPFDSIPLRDYTAGITITDRNFVAITPAIIDASPSTAASITPKANTLINASASSGSTSSGGGGGGGAEIGRAHV